MSNTYYNSGQVQTFSPVQSGIYGNHTNDHSYVQLRRNAGYINFDHCRYG